MNLFHLLNGFNRVSHRFLSTNQTQNASPWLDAHSYLLPHPQKAAKGGEDAFMISPCKRVIGVADGVGGWAEMNVDPAIYARGLMHHALVAVEQSSPQLLLPFEYLKRSWEINKGVLGSSTALLASLDADSTLHICNVGDSAMMIVRDGKSFFRSIEQTHGFNFPYQLGYQGDDISSAQHFRKEVKAGDLVLLATDGLWDNLFDEQILDILYTYPNLSQAALQLATAANIIGHDRKAKSPFAVASSGRFLGGKLDDVTVVLARVQS